MSGPQFFQTRMGACFFDVTMPKIADELARLNTTLLGLANAMSAGRTPPSAQGVASAVPDGPAGEVSSLPRREVTATLTQIAREHLGIVTLEERKLDPVDFSNVGVRSIAAALRAAYETGFALGLSEAAH